MLIFKEVLNKFYTLNKDVKTSHLSPYLAGICLGILLLFTYWAMGTGLGASGAIARISAWLEHFILPNHVENSTYFGAWFNQFKGHVLAYYLVFMATGIFLGGLTSALLSKRFQPKTEHGKFSKKSSRLFLALFGGVLVGIASRLARGCTSGQALTGSALLFTGSIIFLICMFGAGFVAAYFARRQWQ